MKRKIQKWMIKAPFASFCLFGLPFGLLIALLFWFLDAPFWLGCILALLFIFCIYSFIDLAPTLYLQEPAKLNDYQCDPYPLLEETKKLLPLKLRPMARFSITLNHITALMNTGENQEAEALLSTLDISICQNALFQFNFYSLSAELAFAAKRKDQAIYFIERLEQLQARFKPEQLKKMGVNILHFQKANLALLEEEPERALDFLHKVQSTTPIVLVNRSFLLGRAYMMLQDWELAKMWLQQVVQQGNRLYAVEEAQKLLAEIEEIQEK